MDTTTYVITLKKGVTKADIFDTLSRDTSADASVNSNEIPDSAIELSYEQKRLFNKRVFEIDLALDEFEILKNNPDIVGIEYPAVWDDEWLDAAFSQDLKLKLQQIPDSDITYDNWGLWRHSQAGIDWTTANQFADRNVTYEYDYAGEGIDVVIQEGLRVDWDQTEFEDGTTGNTRFVKYQWNRHFPDTENGGTAPPAGSNPGDPDRDGGLLDNGPWLFANIDYDGSSNLSAHKTSCASCAVGTKCGWAKKSKIYDLPYSLVGEAYAFDAIKLFHLDKVAAGGTVRPTVVTASWGKKLYSQRKSNGSEIQDIYSVYFRGTHYTKFEDFVRGDEITVGSNFLSNPRRVFEKGESLRQDGRSRFRNVATASNATVEHASGASDLIKYGLRGQLKDLGSNTERTLFNYSSPAMVAETEELTDAGVFYVKSAGNQSQKIDVIGGDDYNNYITIKLSGSGYIGGMPAFYNRGGGNISHETIVVGALFNVHGVSLTHSTTGEVEYPSSSSERGPRVDCFVAGAGIQTITVGGVAKSETGTSFSTPQAAGMVACLLEKYPGTTPGQARKYFRDIAVSDDSLADGGTTLTSEGYSFTAISAAASTKVGDVKYFGNFRNLLGYSGNITKFTPTVVGLGYDPTTLTALTDSGTPDTFSSATAITEYDFSNMETYYKSTVGDENNNFRYYKFNAYFDKERNLPFSQGAGQYTYHSDQPAADNVYETKRIPQIELYSNLGVNYLEGGMSSSPDTSGFTPSNPTGYVYYTETINGHDVKVGADFDRTEGVGADAGKYIYSPSAIFDQEQSYGFQARTGTDIEFTIDLGRAVHLHAARIVDDGTGFRVPPYIDIWGSTDGTTWTTKVGEFNRADLFISGDGIGQNFQEGIGTHGDTTAANFYSTATMLSVNFSSESIGENLTYFWDFGNGNTSTLQNPSHTYAEPGVYIVTLTVTDALGVSDTVTQTVTIMAPVTASESSGYSPNLYVNLFDNSPEQRLIEDLIIESIKFYGRDLYYIPRKQSGSFDQLYGEDPRKTFVDAYLIEMYIKNVEGFEGEGDLMGRFGLEIRDQTTLTVSIRRFGELILGNPGLSALGITRPREGDLIFMDFVRPDTKYSGKAGMFFEIQFVEHEAIFYQTGSLQTYDLRCETFTYSNETFATGVDVIDAAFANGVSSYVTTGNTMPFGTTADNEIIEREAASILDLSETSPFGDFG